MAETVLVPERREQPTKKKQTYLGERGEWGAVQGGEPCSDRVPSIG